MKVCILYTDFGEFNSAIVNAYFAQKKMNWEVSAPYAQQQDGLVKQHMRTIIE